MALVCGKELLRVDQFHDVRCPHKAYPSVLPGLSHYGVCGAYGTGTEGESFWMAPLHVARMTEALYT